MPLPSFSDDIEKNIIRHIKYRGTIRTGEVMADNGDGTYDVKIALSDEIYPDVETIHYDMVFSTGEIAVLAFEYGSKELPKIIGYGKKIAQTPVEVEVDYSGTGRIDIGDAAIDRDSYVGMTGTKVDRNNPANASGEITSIEIYAVVQMSDVKVATFYVVSEVNPTQPYLSTRDYATLGTVAAGSKQTFSGLNINVQEGDYIGIGASTGGAGSSGQIEKSISLTGLKFAYQTGDNIPCTNQVFNVSTDYGNISIYGTGLT